MMPKALTTMVLFLITFCALPSMPHYDHHVSNVTITNTQNSPYLITMVSLAPYAPVPPPGWCGVNEKPGETCTYPALQPDCWILIEGTDNNEKRLWSANLKIYPKGGDFDNFNQLRITLPSGEHFSMKPFLHTCKKLLTTEGIGDIIEDCPLTIKVSNQKVQFFNDNALEGTAVVTQT